MGCWSQLHRNLSAQLLQRPLHSHRGVGCQDTTLFLTDIYSHSTHRQCFPGQLHPDHYLRGLNCGFRSASNWRGNRVLWSNELQRWTTAISPGSIKNVWMFPFLQPNCSNSKQVHCPSTQQLMLHSGGMLTVLHKQSCHAVNYAILAAPPSCLSECWLGGCLALPLPLPIPLS